MYEKANKIIFECVKEARKRNIEVMHGVGFGVDYNFGSSKWEMHNELCCPLGAVLFIKNPSEKFINDGIGKALGINGIKASDDFVSFFTIGFDFLKDPEGCPPTKKNQKAAYKLGKKWQKKILSHD